MPARPFGSTSTLFGYIERAIPSVSCIPHRESEAGENTYHDRARPQPLRQPAILLDAELPVLGSVHATEHVHDLLVVARLLVLGDLRGEREEQHAAGCEDVIAERLGVGQRDGVVGELDGLAPHNLRDLSCNRGRGEGAIDDMGRAEGFEDSFIVGAGGISDRRELGEPRYLDGCVRDSYQQVQVYAATMK